MGFKSFITKKALQMKGVSADQAEAIAKQLEENPEIAESIKALESNKEVKELFEKITKEIEEKKKAFVEVLDGLHHKLEKLLSLPLENMEPSALQNALKNLEAL